MREHFRQSIWILAGVALLLAACDEVKTGSPTQSGADNEPILGLPTRTLGPIVSFTPRFTATPIPSITFTPSDTPTPTLTIVPPTLTRTPTPTLTPTVAGVIRSTENVNLREGPGTDFPIVVSMPPGTELGVLGVLTDDQSREWYKVSFITDDGEIQSAWVFSNLVETEFKTIVGARATPPLSPETTVLPTPTPEPDRVDILAYCRQKDVRPPRVTTNDNVFVEWSWFVARSEYMDQHLDNAHYEVRLDDRALNNWQRYATEMKLENGVWIIYWYYPVGKLSAGEHEINFRLTWDEVITDGYQEFGPGTAHEVDEGNCGFSVVEP
jgi:uncharacterized protein YraI